MYIGDALCVCVSLFFFAFFPVLVSLLSHVLVMWGRVAPSTLLLAWLCCCGFVVTVALVEHFFLPPPLIVYT